MIATEEDIEKAKGINRIRLEFKESNGLWSLRSGRCINRIRLEFKGGRKHFRKH